MWPLVLAVTTKFGILDATDPPAAIRPILRVAVRVIAVAVRPVATMERQLASSTIPVEVVGWIAEHVPASLVPRTAYEEPAIRQEVLIGALVAAVEAVVLDVDVAVTAGLLVRAVPEVVVLTGDASLTATSTVLVDVVA